MKKIIVRRVIFAMLIIINCVIIFRFSSQNSEQSSETSGGIVNKICDIISKINENVNREKINDTITFIVRKCAHFFIYTLLGIWLISFFNTFDITTKRKVLICLALGILYASSDEFHQKFVSGRSAEIRDICIDSCGILFGNLIVILFGKISKSIRRK